ncbi:MAG: TVP38/TMEM64 family protein [Syntrophorhabdales bacterium]|jgi:uncharacterized membrane protein YdjX (TVP38/TMEM64 family)
MRPWVKQLLLLFLLIAIAAAIRLSGLNAYVTFESLKEHRALLEATVATHYALSVLLYILLYMLTALAIPAALILAVAGGVLFRTFPGVIYATVGATAGGLVAFLLARYLLGNRLQARFDAQLTQFNRGLARHGHLYVVTGRLIPVLPFFLVSYLCGLTRLPLWTFAWATAAGVFPASLVYTFAGTQIGGISSLNDLASPRLFLSFLLLAFLALLPVIWKRLRGRGE